MPKRLSSGTVHKLPADLRKALLASQKASGAWEAISPLARNEWICWVESVKKQETKEQHIKRAVEDLAAGERRPCCWMGCIHRTDKPMNPSQKYILSTRSKRKS
jgi:Bacteriocin-protection, YdeI or OmpD-Associated